MKDIEKIFQDIRSKVDKKIAYTTIALPINVEKHKIKTLAEAKNFLEKMSDNEIPKIYLMKCWLALVYFLYKELMALVQRDNVSMFILPIVEAIVIILATRLLENLTNMTLPGQVTFAKLVLNKKDYDNYYLHKQFNLARVQSEMVGPAAGFSRAFYPDPALEQAFFERAIYRLEHESILRALFCLKKQSFDCVAISGLLFLSLNKAQVNCRIEWLRSISAGWDGHNYIVLNRKEGNIKDWRTWNKDAHILCAWYDVCTALTICDRDQNFFLRYPLLDPSDKTVMVCREQGDDKLYSEYIKKMDALCAEDYVDSNSLPDHFFPTLPSKTLRV